MTNGLIGRKLGMTRVFTEEGAAVPVTIVQAGPCQVVQVRDQAVQLGFGTRRKQRATRGRAGPRQERRARGRAPCGAELRTGGRRAGPGRRSDGGDLRAGRAGQGDRHFQGTRLPGHGAPVSRGRWARRRTGTPGTGSPVRSVRAPTRPGSSRGSGCRATWAPAVTPRWGSGWCGWTPSATCSSSGGRFPGSERHRAWSRSREERAAMIEAPHFSANGSKHKGGVRASGRAVRRHGATRVPCTRR